MPHTIGCFICFSSLAAAARRFSKTPEQMAVFAILAGVIAVVGGLWASLQWNAPAGPSIVVAAALLFLVSAFWEILAGKG